MKPAVINERWELILPDHIADWDAITGWEKVRFADMEEHLRPGMKLWDVGTEHGELSAVYASFVGAENMVLIEPSRYFWSNIRLIWEHNHLAMPIATVWALVGDETVMGTGSEPALNMHGWPACSEGPEQNARAYVYIHEAGTWQGVSQITLDRLEVAVGPPDAITMDIEGAELRALKGAKAVLLEHRPIVWASVHADLLESNYGDTEEALMDYMRGLLYEPVYLGTDHEAHWRFQP